ncbi:MAG: hypothetical protein V3V10_07230 [Planctomycetota bacterium]
MASLGKPELMKILAELSAAAAGEADVEIVGSDAALTASLNAHQLFLAPEDVFASEIVNTAFVSSDGVDLRGPLAIRNIETATKLINFLDSDHVLTMLWGQDAEIIERFAAAGNLPSPDIQFMRSIFAKLKRENPKPAENISQAEYDAFVTKYTETEPRRQLGGKPVSTVIGLESQYAIRLSVIVRLARDFTMQNNDLRKHWLLAAREKQPKLTLAQFERLTDIDFQAFPVVRGVSGIFSKIKDWVVKLFRHPLKALRDVLATIGRLIQLTVAPFTWLTEKFGDSFWFPYTLVGPLVAIVAKFEHEVGRMFVEGSISAFKEQELSLLAATQIAGLGQALAVIGAIIATIPCGWCQAIGGMIAGIGAMLVAIGKAWLYFHNYTRQQRLIREGNFFPVPTARQTQVQTQKKQVSGSSGGGGGGILVAVALAYIGMKAGG